MTNITITSVELALALEKGYTVSNVRAYYEFDKHESFFHAYVKRFVRQKVESEEYEDMDDEALQALIDLYKLEFDMELRWDKMREPKNSGKRALGKAMINTIHGKWGMKFEQEFASWVSPTEYNNLKMRMDSGELEETDFCEITSELALVRMK